MKARFSAGPLVVLTFMMGMRPVADLNGQATRLLRQPISQNLVTFTSGGDIWTAPRSGGRAVLHSLRGIPQLPWSGDGRPDGSSVLYATDHGTDPTSCERLWTVPADGGPSSLLPAPWAHPGSHAPDVNQVVMDCMSRWDEGWRDYRGGQNTPLVILDLQTLDEVRLPNERTTNTHPTWMDGKIYFVSDRDWTYNVWSYDVASEATEQVTQFAGAEVKGLSGNNGSLVFEQDGRIHELDPATGGTPRTGQAADPTCT